MSAFDYDLFVIGAGSGGVRAARIAAEHGARVAIAEEDKVGGTCVVRGCVPKKLLVYGAHFSDDVKAARGYGWHVEPPAHDWAALIANKDREIARLNGIYERLLVDRGVRILRGRATIVSPNEVSVKRADGTVERVQAKKILIATGGEPIKPTFPGADVQAPFHPALRPGIVVAVGQQHDADLATGGAHLLDQQTVGDGLVVGMRCHDQQACARRKVRQGVRC